MSQPQFSEGDRVRLRQGGETLVIDHVAGSLVMCIYMTATGLERKVYPVTMLVHADEDTHPAPPG